MSGTPLRTLPAFLHLSFMTVREVGTVVIIPILLLGKLRFKMRRGLLKVTQLPDWRDRVQSRKSVRSVHVRC